MPAKAGIHDFSRTTCVRIILVVDAGLRRHDGMLGSKPMTFGISGRFLKKAPQKLFCSRGRFSTARSGAKKFFGYFFSKK